MPSPSIDPATYEASAAEQKEVDELLSLFGKGSEVPRGLFLKFEVSRANREIADKGRQEKEERQRLLEQRAQEQKRRIKKLQQARGERDREAVARHQERNRQLAARVKAEEQQWEDELMKQKTALKKQVHDRGSADFHNARLAQQEAAMLQARRDQAQKEYEAHKKLAKETQEQRMRERRGNAGKMRQSVEQAHSGANQKLSHIKGTQANEAREMKNAWREQHKKNEEARLQRARDNRKHAEQVRARARANMDAQRQRRQDVGQKMQRHVDAEAERAKTELMAYKRKLREERYKSRYVSGADAAKLEQSTFRKLYQLNS